MTWPIHIVSASAGSGKTTRLARELEKAILGDGISPDRIVATTFTRKAAAELCERGRRALLAAGRPTEAALFRATRIGTLNAVAGMLVSEFAFEAGVSPDPIVLDEVQAGEAFRRSLGEVITPDDRDDLARLAGCFDELPWQVVVQQIADAARLNLVDPAALDAAAISSARSFCDLLDLPTEAADDLDARLAGALRDAKVTLSANIDTGTDGTKKSAEARDSYERALYRLAAGEPLSWPEWASLAGQEAGARSRAASEGVQRAALAFLAHPRFRDDCDLAIRLTFDLARRALLAYRRFKLERRAIDFVDQETLALGLLQRPDVQDVLSGEISLVLVDEFQDTSPLQLALFLALSRVATRSVWVGDPKQAIYGFRGADPSLMEAVVAGLLGGRAPETLNVGRRSRTPLVELTNALFVPPFREAGLAAAQVVLEPVTSLDPAELGPAVERWRLDADRASEGPRRLAECVRHLLEDASVRIRDRHDGTPRRPRAGDVAILCRRGDTRLAVASALAEVGVAPRVARGGLLATREGRAVSAGLRLFEDPDDLLARAEIAVLVQPATVGIDVLLHGVDRQRWREVEPVACILAAREAAPSAGAIEALDAVLAGLRLDDRVARWGHGSQGRANLDALRAHAVNFVRLARHRGGASSPAALVAHLSSLAADTEDAQATLSGDDAVDIMTWHGAKGLEWPVVVLYEIDGTFPRSPLGVHVDALRDTALKLDAPLDGRTLRYWPSPFSSNTSRTPFHDRLRAHPLAADAADAGAREEVRLLYVGWTRARDRLVLAGRGDLSRGTLSLFTRGGGAGVSEPPMEPGTGVVETPVTWGGRTVTVAVRRPPPGASLAAKTPTSAEVFFRPDRRDHPPARLRPSEVLGRGAVLRTERLGRPMFVHGDVDRLAFGSAIHAFLAADRTELDAEDRQELGGRILDGWGVASALALGDLLQVGERFSRWLSAEWPSGRVRREWPVEHRLPNGTVVRGKVDVVVQTESALALIDHKVIVAGEARALEAAAGYAGQLTTYANALVAAKVRGDLEMVIHLPLSGLVAYVGRAVPEITAAPRPSSQGT